MARKTIPKSLLRDELRKWDESLDFLESTIKKRASMASYLIKYMDSRNLEQYSPEIGKEFLENKLSGMEVPNYLRKNLTCLISILDSICGDVQPSIQKKQVHHKMYGSMANAAEDFIINLKNTKRPSDYTIYRYRYFTSLFTQKMSILNLTWSTLEDRHVMDFMSSRKNGTSQMYACIRGLLGFVYSRGYTKKDLSINLQRPKVHQSEKLPSCYTAEEIAAIENAVDRRSDIGKRDYAIILLASRLGLRSSDIRLLQFKDLDWDNNEIKITQYKTGKKITLPLLSEVGDAIIDYVRNSRPNCSSKSVFLTCSRPHRPLGEHAIPVLVDRYFSRSGVDCNGKHSGSHALRHSLATIMLGEGTPLPVISDVLGHVSSESTMYYLGVDVNSLLKCSLDVPLVDESFYTQKGGILYE